MKVIFVLAALLSAVCAQAGAAEGDAIWLLFEPEIVTLEGFLEKKQFYGPPDYGENPETDQVESALIVRLSSPISVRGYDGYISSERQVENVTHVQLVCGSEQICCANFVNKNVQITGGLFSAFTGHHRAEILIIVAGIAAIE